MRISIHGTDCMRWVRSTREPLVRRQTPYQNSDPWVADKGNAVLIALVLIMVLSTIFVTLAPRISAMKQFAHEYKAQVIRGIEQSNRELMNLYDIY